MPPVRVQLVEKNRLDNQRPEFRPVDSDKLYGAETSVSTAFGKVVDAIPGALLVDYVYGRVSDTTLDRRIEIGRAHV